MSILSNLCPVCHKGKIIRGVWTLNKNCPSCDFKFEREPGYYTSAMIIACLAVPTAAVPTLLVLVYMDKIWAACVLSMTQMILLVPFAIRYSWLFWIQFDHQINKKSW